MQCSFQTIYFSPDETQIGLSRRAEIKEGLLSRKLNKVFLYYHSCGLRRRRLLFDKKYPMENTVGPALLVQKG